MLQHNSSMHGVKINRHPVTWVALLLSSYANNQISVQMSKYRYVPQSYTDDRVEFDISLSQLNENILLEMLMSLEDDRELAVHSKVLIDGVLFHIPMIDFGSKGSSPNTSESIKEFCRYWRMDFNLYESGRSFHAYGNRLLNNDEWLQFMGSLLLLNKPSGYKLIDERWVGHRIMGGYSALRWSKNTSHYKKFPTHCGCVSGEIFSVNTDVNSALTQFLPPTL